jgi:signal transduction histidine kinase
VTRRLLVTYLLLALVVLVALGVPLGILNERTQRRDLERRVERDAVALGTLIEDALQGGAAPGDRVLVRATARYVAETGARVVIVGPRGRLLADSDTSRPVGRAFETRPEIARALDGEVAVGTRRSDTLDQNLLYVAVPVASGGEVHGAVRITVPTSRVDALTRRYWLVLGGVAIAVLLAVALAGRGVALWVSRPLTRLREATRAAGAGDLAVRADASDGPPEVREVAAAFNDTVARLEALVGAQEAFVADASHQLRSPLTALRLRLENLEYAEGPEAAEGLERALAEVQRLARLVDGLLALARPDRRAAERRSQYVSALAAERAESWRHAAEEAGVAIATDIAPGLTAELSPGSLEQVLDNLIANALDAAPAGTAIAIDAAGANCGITLTVTDAGPGMSTEDRERAFDRFWRGAGTPGAHGGSGLGLAIVRRLVEADSGSVRLEEAPGGGLRAVVRLPRSGG